MSARAKPQSAVLESLADVHRYRASFEEAIKQAKGAASAYQEDFVNDVIAEFDKIEAALESASNGEREELVDRAESLSRLRAYVYPPEELTLQAKSALADMSEWSVPPTVLKILQDDVLPVVSATQVSAARAGLYTLFEDYDYWNWYVDWYDDFMSGTALKLVGLLVLLMVAAITALYFGQVITGLIFAGGCGALVSVLSKVPPLSIYGEAASYRLLIRRRLGVGLAASVIGSGFIASGIVTINLPNSTSLSQTISACAGNPPPAATTPATPTSPTAQTPPALPPSPTQGSSGKCSTNNLLILLAVAMLLGFSERGLTSFEDKIFPTSKVPAPGPPPPGPAGPPPIAQTGA